MSILRLNRSETKYCILHNGRITWNSLPDVFKVNVSFSMFKSNGRNYYLEKEILMLGATMIAFFSDMHACICGFQSVIIFGCAYCTVEFTTISFVVIIRIIWIVIVDGFVPVSETIIVRLFQFN